MDTATIEKFKSGLLCDGYIDIAEKEMPAGKFMDEHTHPADVRLLVLKGGATITCSGESKTIKTGDVYELAANIPHTEQYSENGYRIIVGLRKPA